MATCVDDINADVQVGVSQLRQMTTLEYANVLDWKKTSILTDNELQRMDIYRTKD